MKPRHNVLIYSCIFLVFLLLVFTGYSCNCYTNFQSYGFIATKTSLSHFHGRSNQIKRLIPSKEPSRDFELFGVPRLYGWMVENFRGISTPLEKSIISEGVDYFYIDMNALIHCATHGNMCPIVTIEDQEDMESLLWEERDSYASLHNISQQRMRRIVTALLNIFNFVKPKKLMYIAVDGVSPSAKINQQRSRRFRLYKSEDRIKEGLGLEEDISDYTVKKLPIEAYDNVSFNPSYISPGTEFMAMLDYEIRNWIALKTIGGTWNKCYVMYSGTNVPGEGEQKIYETIRSIARMDSGAAYSSHLVYGLDADLIMLSLATKLPRVFVLREERDYTPHVLKKKKPEPFYSKDTGLLHFHSLDFIDFKVNHFEVLSMKNLRKEMHARCMKYVGIKYQLKANSFLHDPSTFYRLTDDFVLLSFLAGNDFLPHLPTVDLSDKSFTDLINTYYFLLPKFKGFLTKNSKIHMGRLQKLMKAISKNEPQYFKQKAVLESVPEYSDQKNYARHYYNTKCGIDYEDKKAIRRLCHKYIEGLFWILSYYHHGCPSWNWCFRNHYAPLVSDLANIASTTITFHKGEPITPLEHLLAITPPSGVHLLPPTYRELPKNSDLSEYFPEDFEICEDGKANEWEHVVKLPFLDTNKLTKAARNVNDELKYNTLHK